MNISINILEIASELAHQSTKVDWGEHRGKMMIPDPNDPETLIYCEEAQQVFNDFYDEYYNLLFKNKIKDSQDPSTEIQKAKETLSKHGYYTENLWSINDVINTHECTEDEAMSVLENVFKGEYVNQEINISIREVASSNGFSEKED